MRTDPQDALLDRVEGRDLTEEDRDGLRYAVRVLDWHQDKHGVTFLGLANDALDRLVEVCEEARGNPLKSEHERLVEVLRALTALGLGFVVEEDQTDAEAEQAAETVEASR